MRALDYAVLARPGWLLPGVPSFQLNADAGQLWLNGVAYYDEASIIGKFGTFSTPSHYEADTDGILRLVGANRLSAFVLPAGKCQGQLIEEERTTLAVYSRTLDTLAWTSDGITLTAAIGADGVLGSAVKLTATKANATILAPAVTSASAARRFAPYVRRITGSGNVDATLDGGTTWTTLSGITASYTRQGIGQTVANPRVGIRIATSGDEVLIDFANGETGSFDTSPILTLDQVLSRAATAIRRTLGSEFNPAACALYANWITSGWATPSGVNENPFTLDDGSTANRIDIYRQNSSANVLGRVTRASSGQADIIGSLSAIGANTRVRGLLRAAPNSIQFQANGNDGTSVTSAAMPTGITTMRIGMNSGGNYVNGYLTSVALFPSNNVAVKTL